MNALALGIVLVHGGFVDGSGWQGVYEILMKDGYNANWRADLIAKAATSVAN